MSLTEIGIFGLIATLFVGWLVMCAVFTRSGNLAIVGEWGANACGVEKPGLHFILWPLRSVMEVVSVTTRTINIANFTVNTLMEDAGDEKVSFRKNEIIPLVSSEISILYHIDFFKPSGWLDQGKLNGYFKLRTAGGFDYASVEEILKDKVQSIMRELSCRRGALTVMSTTQILLNEVRQKINTLLSEQQISVTLIDLTVNSPFRFVNPDHERAVAAKATAVFRLAAVDKEQDVLEREADRQIGIKRKQGEADGEMEKVKLRKLFEAYGIDELPPTHRFIGRLSVGALRAYEKLAQSPNKTFAISTSVMDEIRDMLSRMIRS